MLSIVYFWYFDSKIESYIRLHEKNIAVAVTTDL